MLAPQLCLIVPRLRNILCCSCLPKIKSQRSAAADQCASNMLLFLYETRCCHRRSRKPGFAGGFASKPAADPSPSRPAWAGVGSFKLGPAGLKPPVSLRGSRALELASADAGVVAVWGATRRERIPVPCLCEGKGVSYKTVSDT
jgi:hypothetical protein